MVSAFAFILIKFKCQRKWFPNEVEAAEIPLKEEFIVNYFRNICQS